MKKKLFILAVILAVIIIAVFLVLFFKKDVAKISTRENCEAGGFSWCEVEHRCLAKNAQCGVAQGAVPVVIINKPQSGEIIKSPSEVLGQAPGNWFFESGLSVKLEDDKGNAIASSTGIAQEGWTSTSTIPFSAKLEFATPFADGFLVIYKSNPSGVPAENASFKIPVKFR